ncbi:MAG: adenylate/guanylate cyclase domain-containing protein [Nitrospirota bacterium]
MEQKLFYKLCKLWKRYKYLLGVLLSLLVLGIISLGSFCLEDIFNTFEKKTLDYRFRLLTDPKEARDDIVIIDIDEESIKNMESLYGRWPWTREVHADVIKYLKGAKAIVFDVLFTETSRALVSKEEVEEAGMRVDEIMRTEMSQKSETVKGIINSFYHDYDKLLAESCVISGNVYFSDIFQVSGEEKIDDERRDWINKFALPIKFTHSLRTIKSFDSVTSPLPILCDAVKGVGHINMIPDDDGPVRRAYTIINFDDKLYPSLSLAVAMDMLKVKEIEVIPGRWISLDKKVKIPINEDGTMFINYKGGFKTYRYYPYYLLFASNYLIEQGQESLIDPEIFKDKIVLIGSTAAGLMDLRVNPFSSVYPGVEIHANIIDNILSNSFLQRPPFYMNLLVMLFLSILIGLFIPKLKPFAGAIFALEILILYLLAAIYLFNYNRIWLDIFRPGLNIMGSYLVILVYRFMTVEQERKKTKEAFQHFVNATVVDEILKDPEKLKLWGEENELTVLFSDIRGFTTFAENLPPKEVVSLLNEYLQKMTEVVFKYDGTLDKYVGDEIMAFYGAPLKGQTDHAERACRTAIDMMKELHKLNDQRIKKGQPSFNIGIGINTGKMVVGNIGSDLKKDYTVIGDNVNLGARLEGTNKKFETNIIISEFTYEKVKDKVTVRELGSETVKGKQKPVKIYELLGMKE